MVCRPSDKKVRQDPDSLYGDFIFKYQYKPRFRRISQESETVPDLVMPMSEVYQRYALTGDIASLPGAVVVEPEEFDGDSYMPEEMTDTLLHAQILRENAAAAALEEESDHQKKVPSDDDKEQSDEKEEGNPSADAHASELDEAEASS